MEAYAAVLMYAIPAFVVLIVLEAVVAKIRGMQVNRAMDMISSLSSGMTNTLKGLMGLTIIILSYGWMVDKFAIFDIQSSVALYVLAFIGHDFAGYWSHRFNHKINIMWNRHIIHHSSEEFNLSCALRQTVSNFFGVYFFLYIPMAIIGIPEIIVAIVAPLHLFAQFWYHTRLIDKMGILEKVLVTPSHHRVHHAINDIYIDKNFSEIFIVWDKWFGTFQPELDDVPPVYGIKKQANTWNPLLINFMHVWMLIKDAWRTQSWWDKLRLWFMPTGWRPADVAERYPVDVITDVYGVKKYDSSGSAGLKAWSWIQLIIHNMLMYYILARIADFPFFETLLYASFLMLSVFAYTSLMDRHKVSLIAEISKLVFGFILIQRMGSWFNIEEWFAGGTYVIMGYMVISLFLNVFFLYIEKSRLETPMIINTIK